MTDYSAELFGDVNPVPPTGRDFSADLFGGEATTPIEKPQENFFARIGQDMTNRVGEISKNYNAYASDNLGGGEALYRGISNGPIGAVKDIANEGYETVGGGLVNAMDFLNPNFKKELGKTAEYLKTQDPVTAPIYTAAKEGATQIGENYNNLMSYNQDAVDKGASENISAMGNNAALIPSVQTIKMAAPIIGAGMSAASEPIINNAVSRAAKKRFREVQDIYTPKLTPKVIEEQAGQQVRQPITGNYITEPNTFQKSDINHLARLPVSGAKPLRSNYNIIRDANVKEAQVLEAKLLEAAAANPKAAIIPKSQILSDVESKLAPLRNDPYLKDSPHLNTVFEDLANQIPEDGVTASQLLKIRQKLDNNIEAYKGDKSFDPKTYNAFTKAAKVVRHATNDIVDQKYPNIGVRASLEKQHSFYKAMKNISTKMPMESPNAAVRAAKKVIGSTTAKALTIKGGLGAAGIALPASVSLPLAAAGGVGYLGYKGLKLATSPAVQKALGVTLDRTGRALQGKNPLVGSSFGAAAEAASQPSTQMLLTTTAKRPDVGGRGMQPRAMTDAEWQNHIDQQIKAQETGLTYGLRQAQQAARVSQYERENPANNIFNKIGEKPIMPNQTAMHPEQIGFPRSTFPE